MNYQFFKDILLLLLPHTLPIPEQSFNIVATVLNFLLYPFIDPRMWPLGHKVGLWNGFASVRLSVCPSVRLRSLISDISDIVFIDQRTKLAVSS